jgi:hypothetical protein
LFSLQEPPLVLEVPIPQVPTSVCSLVEVQLPLPEAVPSRQSKSMLMPDTGLAETGEGGEVLGSAPATGVVRCVIVPVKVPVLGVAAPAGHL